MTNTGAQSCDKVIVNMDRRNTLQTVAMSASVIV